MTNDHHRHRTIKYVDHNLSSNNYEYYYLMKILGHFFLIIFCIATIFPRLDSLFKLFARLLYANENNPFSIYFEAHTYLPIIQVLIQQVTLGM